MIVALFVLPCACLFWHVPKSIDCVKSKYEKFCHESGMSSYDHDCESLRQWLKKSKFNEKIVIILLMMCSILGTCPIVLSTMVIWLISKFILPTDKFVCHISSFFCDGWFVGETIVMYRPFEQYYNQVVVKTMKNFVKFSSIDSLIDGIQFLHQWF